MADDDKAISKRDDTSPKEGENKYGDVEFADAKNKKYPIDTAEHIRAAWNYLSKEENAAKYSADEVNQIKSKIIAAWKDKIDKAGPPSAEKKTVNQKSGSRHSKSDQEHGNQAMAHMAQAGFSVPAQDEGDNQKSMKISAAKMLSVAKAIPEGWNAKDYACSEGWDAATVSGIIAQLTSLFSSEMYQQDQAATALILDSIATLSKYLTGELAGMKEGMLAAAPVQIEMKSNALKAISATEDELRVGNYIVLFGGTGDISPFGVIGNDKPVWKNADGSVGETFAKTVELDSDYTFTGRLPLDWEHGGAELEKDEVLGYVDWKSMRRDERGVFVERVLNRRKKYVQWVEELINAGLIGTSSECVDGKSVRTAAGEIVKWPLKRDTLTVAPAEYRMMKEFGGNVITALKALKLVDDTAGQPAPEGAADTKSVIDATTTNTTNKDGDTMTEEEKKALQDVTAKVATLEAKNTELETNAKAMQEKLDAPVLHPNGVGSEPATPADRKGPYKHIGQQLQDIANLELRKGDTEKAANRLKAVVEDRKALGMNEAVPSEGGHMVQTAFGTNLLERTYAIGQVMSEVQEQPIGDGFDSYSALLIDETSRATGSRYGGIQFYRLGEGGTMLPTRPKLRRLKIEAEKIAAACYATDELLEDSTALNGHINRLFPLEARFTLENELFNGSGSGQSQGILGANATVSVAKETNQAATTFKYENALKMLTRLYAPSVMNAKWYIHQDVLEQIYQFALAVGTGGAPVFLPPTGASGAPYGTLLGRPIVPVEYCQTLGTTGDVYLADFSQYLAVTKGGIKSDSSMHVAFLTGEMTFRFQWRYRAEPIWNNKLTPMNGSNTVSPFVKLDTRS